jgi:hypothetical protein
LNCVGPYRFYGEDVVKACVENGAHHIDISGQTLAKHKGLQMYFITLFLWEITAINFYIFAILPGANPMIASYNAL